MAALVVLGIAAVLAGGYLFHRHQLKLERRKKVENALVGFFKAESAVTLTKDVPGDSTPPKAVTHSRPPAEIYAEYAAIPVADCPNEFKAAWAEYLKALEPIMLHSDKGVPSKSETDNVRAAKAKFQDICKKYGIQFH